MSSVTGAVHWWEEWQLRVLVLCSMAVQFLLLIFSSLRRHAIPGWVRFMTWLAYLAGDAVAIYALATLFNRHKTEEHGGSSSSMLEVVWAPVLLIHLGGQDGITAYNIEDNELWSRHLLTAVSQVTVAIYVFCKSWTPGGDKWLLQTAVALFVPGVLKCFLKPWALKRASINSLVSSPPAAKQDTYLVEHYVKLAKEAFVGEQNDEDMPEEDEDCPRHNKENGRAKGLLKDGEGAPSQGSLCGRLREKFRERRRDQAMNDLKEEEIRKQRLQEVSEVTKLFVDLSFSYPRRLSILKHFLGLTSQERAYGSLRRGLSSAFLLLYTRLRTVGFSMKSDIVDYPKNALDRAKRLCSQFILGLRISLPMASIVLFHHSNRGAYNDVDVKITYAILCCTAVVEVSSEWPLGVEPVEVDNNDYRDSVLQESWPKMVAQYNLTGYFIRNKRHNNKMRIVTLLGCKDFLDQHWCMEPCFSSARITESVRRYLVHGWMNKIQQDVASYYRFNDNRGHWALEGTNSRDLDRSIQRPFDESVLLWHIATDFCFFSGDAVTQCEAIQCSQMSNYMAYLLFVNPEMLLPGSRRNLFRTAHEELEAMFKGEKPPLDKTELTLKIISKLESSSEGSLQTFIHEAWIIAQRLQSLGDEKMWEVIHGVWVEMLCFSAGRCRGYLHAKALGKGGEFLSYVWLLLFYMGMETFTDKLQREDLPSYEAAGNNAATAPPSASKAHADAAGASAAPSTSEICIAQDDMV